MKLYRVGKNMTYYEKLQNLQDEIIFKAIKGTLPISCAKSIKEFDNYKLNISNEKASMEVKRVYKC